MIINKNIQNLIDNKQSWKVVDIATYSADKEQRQQAIDYLKNKKISRTIKYVKKFLKNIFRRMFKKNKNIQEWQSDVIEKNLTKEKMDFVYENGIEYMKEVKSGFDKINQKSTLLLLYLVIVIVYCAKSLLNVSFYDKQHYTIFLICIILSYICIIFYITYRLLYPKLSEAIYNEPKNLLNNDNMQHKLELIKFYSSINMQHRIEKLLIEQNLCITYLKISIIFTFSIPIIIAALLFIIKIQNLF